MQVCHGHSICGGRRKSQFPSKAIASQPDDALCVQHEAVYSFLKKRSI